MDSRQPLLALQYDPAITCDIYLATATDTDCPQARIRTAVLGTPLPILQLHDAATGANGINLAGIGIAGNAQQIITHARGQQLPAAAIKMRQGAGQADRIDIMRRWAPDIV